MSESKPRTITIQFTLKSLLALMLLVARSLGAYSLGKKEGRKDAQPEIDQLNQECADMMNQHYAGGGTIVSFPGIGTTPSPKNRSYDFTIPEDRNEYRKTHPNLTVY
jgi:hypothetical protein